MKLSKGALALLATALGASVTNGCVSEASEPAVSSEELLVSGTAEAGRFEVEPNRLLVAAEGNEDLLRRKIGSVIVSGPDATRGSKNPHGFLRRIRSVARHGTKIVI